MNPKACFVGNKIGLVQKSELHVAGTNFQLSFSKLILVTSVENDLGQEN